jgi:signal recognition particle GTPase
VGTSQPTFDDLSPEQQAAARDIARAFIAEYLGVEPPTRVIVISGAGGTGKTTTVAVALGLIREWLSRRKAALAAAGSAANQLTQIVRSQSDFQAYMGGLSQTHAGAVAAAAAAEVKTQKAKARELADAAREAELDAIAEDIASSFMTNGASYDF